MGEVSEIIIEGAEIIWPNFEGREGPYNAAGQRSFGVRLPEELALQMDKDGWNVKYLKPRDEDDDEDRPWIDVSINFNKGKPPQIYLISSKARTKLGEKNVKTLDIVNLKTVDLILNPYVWDVNGKTGIKAYLKSGYFVIDEDPFEKKYKIYEDPPDAED